jgi:hypothetical protein
MIELVLLLLTKNVSECGESVERRRVRRLEQGEVIAYGLDIFTFIEWIGVVDLCIAVYRFIAPPILLFHPGALSNPFLPVLKSMIASLACFSVFNTNGPYYPLLALISVLQW